MTIPSAWKETALHLGLRAVDGVKATPVESITDTSNIDIIDIRHDSIETDLKEEILGSLAPKIGPKTLPTLLLYDSGGLQLFEEVCLSNMLQVGHTNQMVRLPT